MIRRAAAIATLLLIGIPTLIPSATTVAQEAPQDQTQPQEQTDKPAYCDDALNGCITDCSILVGPLEDGCELGCWIGYINCG